MVKCYSNLSSPSLCIETDGFHCCWYKQMGDDIHSFVIAAQYWKKKKYCCYIFCNQPVLLCFLLLEGGAYFGCMINRMIVIGDYLSCTSVLSLMGQLLYQIVFS